jgi:hypothetical protein
LNPEDCFDVFGTAAGLLCGIILRGEGGRGEKKQNESFAHEMPVEMKVAPK